MAQYEAMTIEWRRDMADAEFGIDMAPPAFARIAKARRIGELEDF